MTKEQTARLHAARRRAAQLAEFADRRKEICAERGRAEEHALWRVVLQDAEAILRHLSSLDNESRPR